MVELEAVPRRASLDISSFTLSSLELPRVQVGIYCRLKEHDYTIEVDIGQLRASGQQVSMLRCLYS